MKILSSPLIIKESKNADTDYSYIFNSFSNSNIRRILINNMFFIYPYKKGSKSARVLRDGLQGKLIKLKNSRYRMRNHHVVINYGNSTVPDWLDMSRITNVLNTPESVGLASNKLKTFLSLEESEIPTVPFTQDKRTAESWLNEGHKVYVRQTLTGHSGEGIEVISPQETTPDDFLVGISDELAERGYDHLANEVDREIELIVNSSTVDIPDAPLYTKGVANTGEYRVHVVDGDVILYQKKSRRYVDEENIDEPTEQDSDVRNLASGWVYRTGNLNRLERIEELAINTIDSLGLDFGAVDIIKDEHGDVFVLEVNTAPGLGNTQTKEAYIDAFMSR
jgi:hypothetical protein